MSYSEAHVLSKFNFSDTSSYGVISFGNTESENVFAAERLRAKYDDYWAFTPEGTRVSYTRRDVKARNASIINFLLFSLLMFFFVLVIVTVHTEGMDKVAFVVVMTIFALALAVFGRDTIRCVLFWRECARRWKNKPAISEVASI